MALLEHLFVSEVALLCLNSADANDDVVLDISDAVAVLIYLFGGGGDLPAPFGECGVDPTAEELGCSSFPPCGVPR